MAFRIRFDALLGYRADEGGAPHRIEVRGHVARDDDEPYFCAVWVKLTQDRTAVAVQAAVDPADGTWRALFAAGVHFPVDALSPERGRVTLEIASTDLGANCDPIRLKLPGLPCRIERGRSPKRAAEGADTTPVAATPALRVPLADAVLRPGRTATRASAIADTVSAPQPLPAVDLDVFDASGHRVDVARPLPAGRYSIELRPPVAPVPAPFWTVDGVDAGRRGRIEIELNGEQPHRQIRLLLPEPHGTGRTAALALRLRAPMPVLRALDAAGRQVEPGSAFAPGHYRVAVEGTKAQGVWRVDGADWGEANAIALELKGRWSCRPDGGHRVRCRIDDGNGDPLELAITLRLDPRFRFCPMLFGLRHLAVASFALASLGAAIAGGGTIASGSIPSAAMLAVTGLPVSVLLAAIWWRLERPSVPAACLPLGQALLAVAAGLHLLVPGVSPAGVLLGLAGTLLLGLWLALDGPSAAAAARDLSAFGLLLALPLAILVPGWTAFGLGLLLGGGAAFATLDRAPPRSQ